MSKSPLTACLGNAGGLRDVLAAMRRGLALPMILTATTLLALMGCTSTTDPQARDAPAAHLPSPAASTPSTSAAENLGRLVTSESELAGKWRAESLFGQPVAQPKGPASHPVDVTFSHLAPRWWWNTDDGCNDTGGRLSVTSAGVLTTGAGVSTLVGCIRGIRGAKDHGANTKAIERSDGARIQPGDGAQPPVLTLLSGGMVIAVYRGPEDSPNE
ncbi:MAG: hypothetical protein ABI720_05905 [Actinomycetes bacterium]